VLPRGLVALFGTLTLSVVFTVAIGQPGYALFTWMFTFGFAWAHLGVAVPAED
jgi:hypothetical protein